MSVCVNLKILPESINNKEWSGLYKESLKLLKAYPDLLMGIQSKDIFSSKRLYYSRELEHNKDNFASQYWLVCGDLTTKKFNDSFKLFNDINNYRKNSNFNNKEKDFDILIKMACEESEIKTNDNTYTVDVFNEITGGASYHIPILAVGMLVEDSFVGKAAVSGDIDKSQAIKAQELIKNVLKKNVNIPVCVDSERLFKRISKYYNEEEAIANSRLIYRGELREWFKTTYSLCDKKIFSTWFMKELKSINTPDSPDIIDLYMEWLNATGDLIELCKMACIYEKGPKFEAITFVRALASTWIGIDESEFEFLSIFQDNENPDQKSGYGMMFMNVDGFMGKKLSFHMNIDDILIILKEIFGEKYNVISEAFIKGTLDAEKQLIRLNDPIKDLLEGTDKEGEDLLISGESFIFLDDMDKASKKHVMMLKVLANALYNLIRIFYEKKPEIIEKDSGSLLSQLSKISTEYGPLFTEDAWEWIDKENKDMIQMLLILLAMNREGRKFWNMRRGIFENNAQAKAVLKMIKAKK